MRLKPTARARPALWRSRALSRSTAWPPAAPRAGRAGWWMFGRRAWLPARRGRGQRRRPWARASTRRGAPRCAAGDGRPPPSGPRATRLPTSPSTASAARPPPPWPPGGSRRPTPARGRRVPTPRRARPSLRAPCASGATLSTASTRCVPRCSSLWSGRPRGALVGRCASGGPRRRARRAATASRPRARPASCVRWPETPCASGRP